MKKSSILWASVLVIGMGMSMTAWSEEAPAQTDDGIGGLLSSLSDILPENVNVGSVLQTVGGVLEEAGSTVNQALLNVADKITDENGSVDWQKVQNSAEELVDYISGGLPISNIVGGAGYGETEQDLDALLADLMIPYEKADAVMYDYIADRNAEFMDAGDVQIFSKKTGYMGDPEADEFKVLGDFTQVNYVIDGEQMNMVSAATDTLLLTLTKGEDGTCTVTDEKSAEDGEAYSASLKALCEEVGISVDEVNASSVLGAYNDANALADYLDGQPEIKTAEYQGEQLTAEELHSLSENYINDLMDSIFGETEE